METPREENGEAQSSLDQAEGQDDAARLQALEDLHRSLETELERDDPQQDQPSPQ